MNPSSAEDRAGCVGLRQSLSTGAVVGIYDAHLAQLDETDGPWVTVCEEHGYLMNHHSLWSAHQHSADTLCWCSECLTEWLETNGG